MHHYSFVSGHWWTLATDAEEWNKPENEIKYWTRKWKINDILLLHNMLMHDKRILSLIFHKSRSITHTTNKQLKFSSIIHRKWSIYFFLENTKLRLSSTRWHYICSCFSLNFLHYFYDSFSSCRVLLWWPGHSFYWFAEMYFSMLLENRYDVQP